MKKYTILLAMILICVVMCIRIDHVCRAEEIPMDSPVLQVEVEEILHYDELALDPLESLGEFELTWYCTGPCCCGSYANGLTATGTPATPGRTIAVDPEKIPYGTHVMIAGREYVAEDCGGAIRGNRIDILAGNHAEALQNGRQTAGVYVIR